MFLQDVVAETYLQEHSPQSLRENESVLIPDGVSDLLTLQTRIRAVEKIMMEELKRRVRQKNLTEGTGYSALDVGTYAKIETRKKVTELKEESMLDHNTWRKKPKIRLLMKDIPLDRNVDDRHSKYWKREHRRTDDHMLELCETNDHEQVSAPIEDVIVCHLSDNSGRYLNYSSELDIEKELGVDKLELSKTVREKNEDDKRRRILERLVSDGQKLAILKMALQDLKKKTETKKKSKQGNDFEYETVKRHIEEVEEAVMQQASMNDQMAKNVEEGTSYSLDREIPMELEKYGHVETRRMSEQARRGSDQIGRLQFEVQNIQYILVKLAEENNIIVKNRISGKTGILLREFIQIGRTNSKRRRKLRVCGCSKPSTNED